MILVVAKISSGIYSIALTPSSFAQANGTQANSSENMTTSANNETSTQVYILNIKS